MRISYFVIILGIIIVGSAIFVISFESSFRDKHYEIEITGMKDVYLVGGQYDFSYIISGYGQSCGSKTIHFPDEDGEYTRTFFSASCAADTPMKIFVFDLQKEQGTTYGHVGIKDPGWYNVIVELNYENAQKSHEFFVVENNCDDSPNEKSKTQCLVKSHESCTSAYMTQKFISEEDDNGSEISLVATVQSWNDCNLTVYTENSLDGHTPFNGIRSICEDITVNEDSLNFENCDNADYPPIMFDIKQDSDAQTELVEKSPSSSCPDGINDEFDTQRKITSCGANPPQAKSSILELNGIQTCLSGSDQIYYMNSGERGTVTYSYEITENKRNPNEKFDLGKPPHFMCSPERGVWKECNPEGINVSYDTDKKYISVREPTIITAEIQINDGIPAQIFQLHLSPNICAYPELLFNVLGDDED